MRTANIRVQIYNPGTGKFTDIHPEVLVRDFPAGETLIRMFGQDNIPSTGYMGCCRDNGKLHIWTTPSDN